MTGKKKDAHKFEFRKSLKEDSKYPILNYFRVERYFTRPLASLVVRAVFNTSITPNQITLFSFFVGVCGAISFSRGKPIYFLLGGILAQLASIFDCADGMLARSKGLCSEYGAYLDLFLDRITEFLIFSSISIGYYIFSNDLRLFIACLFGIGLFFMQLALYYLTKIYQKNTKPGEAAEARGLCIFLIMVFSIFNRLDLLIYLLLITIVCIILIRIGNLIRLGLLSRN